MGRWYYLVSLPNPLWRPSLSVTANSPGIMHIRTEDRAWHPIRACFRYVTNAPWKRIPVRTKTLVMNKIVACLAGGRNKMMAHRYFTTNNILLKTT